MLSQEFLNAVSFSKGCYLGQELTHDYNPRVVRKRIVPVMIVGYGKHDTEVGHILMGLVEGKVFV